MNFIKNFIKEEDGVTAIEYALIAGVIITAVTLLGGNISSLFTALANKISTTVK
jgi:pilus assembly protein Flp/PilA